MGKTLNMTLDEIYAHFPDGVPFPDAIPKEFIDEVDAARKPHYLWILPGGKVHCDACGFEFSEPSLHTINHKKMSVCPHCQSSLEARKAWLGQTSARRHVLSYHFAKSVSNPDVITCMAVYTCYGYQGGEAPWETELFRVIDGLYVFVPGRGTAYACPWRIYPRSLVVMEGQYTYKDVRWYPYNHFNLEARSYLRVRGDIYPCRWNKPENGVFEYENKMDILKTAKGTPFEYAVNAYSKVLPRSFEWEKLIMFIDKITRYPVAMEVLAKMGLAKTVYNRVCRGASLNHVFNLRGKNVPAIFKGQVNKADKKYLYKNGDDMDFTQFEIWQKLRKHGLAVPLIETLMLMGLSYGLLDTCLHLNIGVSKAVRYVGRQKEKYGFFNAGGTYRDYLEDCIYLSRKERTAHIYNLKDKSVLFPQNIEKAHAHSNEMVRFEKQQQALDEFNAERETLAKELSGMEMKYKKIRPRLEKKYSYEAMGYVIVVPPDLVDLHREGMEMHNCVANYASRIAQCDTQVVYIRAKEDPGHALGTMEISMKEEIIQARGHANKSLPAEADEFVKMFEHDVLMPLRAVADGLTR